MKDIIRSNRPMKIAKTAEKINTTLVELIRFSRVGQETRENSPRTSLVNVLIFSHIPQYKSL